MKSLNEKELLYIDKIDLQEKLAKEKLISCILEVKNLELSIKNLSLNLAAKKNDLETLRNAETQARMVRSDTLKTIAKKKNLKEGWGYNPDTGEIIEN